MVRDYRRLEKALTVVATVLLLVAIYLLWANGARCEGVAHADPVAEDQANGDDVRFQAHTEDHAVAMIRYWIRLAPRHPMSNVKRQRRFATLQVAATEVYGTPLSLTMAMMFKESSGIPTLVGSRGEIGLMQVHPATGARHRCDLTKPRGQIVCGHKVLRAAYDHCGTWEGALARYASSTGTCSPKRGSNLAAVVKSRFKLAAELERAAGVTR